MESDGQAGVREASAETMQFVENVGLYFESVGLQRMAGRVLGWLLICEPPHQSAEELATALRASSGSISTTARLLMRMGFVERVAIAHNRRAFYQLRPDAWGTAMEERGAEMKRLRVLAEEGLAAVGDAPQPHRRRLTEMRELFAFVESEFPALVRRYHEQQEGS
ncbi:MAG: GbsR/MarR family transcriptional regulator [Pseudonocardia sp.]